MFFSELSEKGDWFSSMMTLPFGVSEALLSLKGKENRGRHGYKQTRGH